MTIDTYVLFIGFALLQSGTPGPSVVLVISNAIRHGFRNAMFAFTADLLGISLLATLSALGAGAILLANVQLFYVIKILGAAYLFFIGATALLKLRLSKVAASPSTHITYEIEANRHEMWAQSFFVSISNPKAILFFGALFPQFVDTSAPPLPQFVLLMITFLSVKAGLLATYAIIAARVRHLHVSQWVRQTLTLVKGVIFIAFGVLLLKGSITNSEEIW